MKVRGLFTYGEGEAAVLVQAKDLQKYNRPIESATPCHDTYLMGLYLGSNLVTILAAMQHGRFTPLRHTTTSSGCI